MRYGSEQVSVSDLSVGMHVMELDRPWHETPFPIQGFYIRSEDEISALKFYCKSVHVEMDGDRFAREKESVPDPEPSEINSKKLKVPEIIFYKKKEHPVVVPIREEIETAKVLIDDLQSSMASVLKKSVDTGEIDYASVSGLAEDMTQSIIRNPDALLFLSRIKDKDAHTYNHCLKTSIWAMIIAREYGLAAETIKNIGRSGLMSKIGREAIMDKMAKCAWMPNSQKISEYRKYPELGADILKKSQFHKVVEESVRYHRERHDGSGFPNGLTGEKIPVGAKILGIADYYEFLVESRDGKMGMSPSSASSHLYNSRDVLFQSDLVDKLIETIGVYPIGSNVILSNGKMAVITENNKDSRLYPVVRVIKDENGHPLETIEEIDLSDQQRETETPIIIKSCLPFYSANADILQRTMNEEAIKTRAGKRSGVLSRLLSRILKK